MTAQISAVESANILHVNTSMNPQTPATLKVPKNGEYLVTVLPIYEGRGILDGMAFSQMHVVNDLPSTTQGIKLGCVVYFELMVL